MNKAQVAAIRSIVNQIRPLLSGRGPEIQAGVLADLVAIHFAGHVVPGDPAATATMHEELLALHVEAVRALIPVNAEIIHGKAR